MAVLEPAKVGGARNFLSAPCSVWPIKDVYLEFPGKRCLDICKNDKREPRRDLSESGVAEVDAIRQELREAPNSSFKQKPLRGSA